MPNTEDRFFKTGREKTYFILFMICMVLFVVTLVVSIISGYYFYNIRKRASTVATYVSGMVDQSQTAINAVKCLQNYYKTYEYFDASGTDKSVTIYLTGQIGGVSIGGDGYNSSVGCICKGLTTDTLISELGLSKYVSSKADDENNVSSIDSNAYLELSYVYPENVQHTIKYDLSSYYYNSSEGDNIESAIKSNWLKAFTVSSSTETCTNNNKGMVYSDSDSS